MTFYINILCTASLQLYHLYLFICIFGAQEFGGEFGYQIWLGAVKQYALLTGLLC